MVNPRRAPTGERFSRTTRARSQPPTFVVPTPTFRLLFVLVILAHDRRRILHADVTAHPSAGWIAQQLRNAFPEDEAPQYLVHDRDSVFTGVATTLGGMRIEAVRTAPRSPWQNGYVERLIGSIRRECLDHVIVINEAGLRRVLTSYVAYYMRSRTHLALAKDSLCLPETPYKPYSFRLRARSGRLESVASLLIALLHSLRFLVRSRASLHLEIVALRHQLAVVNRSRRPRLRLTAIDRVLWASLSRTWRGWRAVLHIVTPETVVGWHRRGFRLFWTWKSRHRTGRPGVPATCEP